MDINRKSLFWHCDQCIDVFEIEVTDMRRACFPFLSFHETIHVYNSETVTSGGRPWTKNVCAKLSIVVFMTTVADPRHWLAYYEH